MTSHKFTPDQSELILEAVSTLIGFKGNAYSFVGFINYLCNHELLNGVGGEDSDKELLTPEYILEMTWNNQLLCDLFMSIEDAINHN